jgi:hypothetical protein
MVTQRLFRIIIFNCYCRFVFKYRRRVGKIDVVLSKIGGSLFRIPFVRHNNSVCTFVHIRKNFLNRSLEHRVVVLSLPPLYAIRLPAAAFS